jgi:hypothetical protein
MLATRHIARLVAVGAALHAARMRAKTSGGRAPGTPNGPVQALPPGLGMGTRRRMATARWARSLVAGIPARACIAGRCARQPWPGAPRQHAVRRIPRGGMV